MIYFQTTFERTPSEQQRKGGIRCLRQRPCNQLWSGLYSQSCNLRPLQHPLAGRFELRQLAGGLYSEFSPAGKGYTPSLHQLEHLGGRINGNFQQQLKPTHNKPSNPKLPHLHPKNQDETSYKSNEQFKYHLGLLPGRPSISGIAPSSTAPALTPDIEGPPGGGPRRSAPHFYLLPIIFTFEVADPPQHH